MKLQIYSDGRVCMEVDGEFRDLAPAQGPLFVSTLGQLMHHQQHMGIAGEVNAYMLGVWEHQAKKSSAAGVAGIDGTTQPPPGAAAGELSVSGQLGGFLRILAALYPWWPVAVAQSDWDGPLPRHVLIEMRGVGGWYRRCDDPVTGDRNEGGRDMHGFSIPPDQGRDETGTPPPP